MSFVGYFCHITRLFDRSRSELDYFDDRRNDNLIQPHFPRTPSSLGKQVKKKVGPTTDALRKQQPPNQRDQTSSTREKKNYNGGGAELEG